MKIMMLVSLSNGKQAGHIHECDEDEAGRMIAARFALPYVEDKTERAVKADVVETRVKSKKK